MGRTEVASLVRLGRALQVSRYSFVTVTPETHRRVLARGQTQAKTLADVFGWNHPFADGQLPADVERAIHEEGLAERVNGGWRSRVRFSTLHGDLFAHSAFPTDAVDAVFFGPDTYRFCRAIRHAARHAGLVIDIGCGSGAGGIVASREARRVIFADINADALVFAEANAVLNGIEHAEFVQADVLGGIHERPDLVLANPPYLRDPLGRTYRDGGGSHGEALSVRIAQESLDRLAPRGTLLLYTGTAIVDGVDQFFARIAPILERARAHFRYEEVDPDVFGEELSADAYAGVDRIAAVVLEATVG